MVRKKCTEYCTQRKDYECCFECDIKNECKLDPVCKYYPPNFNYKTCEHRGDK